MVTIHVQILVPVAVVTLVLNVQGGIGTILGAVVVVVVVVVATATTTTRQGARL